MRIYREECDDLTELSYNFCFVVNKKKSGLMLSQSIGGKNLRNIHKGQARHPRQILKIPKIMVASLRILGLAPAGPQRKSEVSAPICSTCCLS